MDVRTVSKNRLILSCIATGLTACIIGGLWLSQIWYEPIDLMFRCIYGLPLTCLFALSGIIVFGVSLNHILRPDSGGLSILWPALTFLLISMSFILIGPRIETYRINQILDTFTPLIEAIEKYEQDNSHAPNKLEDLVPQYIPSLPEGVRSGGFINRYDSLIYYYSNDSKIHGWDNNRWALMLYILNVRSKFQ